MQLKRLIAFSLSILSFSIHTTAQDFKKMTGHRFTKAEINEMLLDHSKKQKSKAIGALILGPVLTGAGAYLMNKDPFIISGSGGYITVRESNTAAIGKAICATGILTTLASVPFFISAGKAKKEARLLLRDESTSYLQNRIAIPSLGLQIKF